MKTITLKPKKRTPKLEWSKSPTRSRNEFSLGLRKRWLTSCRCFAIEQFPEVTGRYIAITRLPDAPSHILGNFPTIAAAKRACELAQKGQPK